MFEENPPANSMKMSAWCCGVAFLCFSLTVWLLNLWLPPIAVYEVSKKVTTFAQSGTKYDTLLIGSSHVLTQLDPVRFDQETRGLGFPTHAYNFGVTGLSPQEMDYLLERIFASSSSGHLRYILMELNPQRLDFPKLFENTTREVFSHDYRRTLDTTEALWAHRAERQKKGAKQKNPASTADLLWLHWCSFLQRETHLGQGAEWIASWSGKRKANPEDLKTTPEGFYPLQHAINAEDRQSIQQALESYRTGAAFPGTRLGDNLALPRLISQLRARNLVPIFFVSPIIAATSDQLIAEAKALDVPILRFDNPITYPALYAPENRADILHLNAIGAQIFTPLVAQQFVAAIRSHASSSPPSPSPHALR